MSGTVQIFGNKPNEQNSIQEEIKRLRYKELQICLFFLWV